MQLIEARRAGIVAATLCACAAGAAIGLAHPLIAVSLERMTGSGAVIGVNALAGGLSTLVMALMAPRLVAWLGGRTVLIAAAFSGAAAYAAFGLWRDVNAWLVLRFIFGGATGLMFLVSETWISQLVSPESRARVLTIYGGALAGSYSMGAALFAVVGTSGAGPFVLGAVLCALCALAALIRAPRVRRPGSHAMSMSAIVAAAVSAPVAIAAGVSFGMIETASASFLAVWGLRIGFTEAGAGLLLVAMGLGNVVLQPFIGAAADRFGILRLLVLCAIGGVIFPLILLAAPVSLGLALVICFFYSGTVVAMYALGLSLISARFSASRIVSANAAFIFAYGIGSIVSPPATGLALDGLGAPGVLWAFAAFAGLFLAVQLVLRRRAAAA